MNILYIMVYVYICCHDDVNFEQWVFLLFISNEICKKKIILVDGLGQRLLIPWEFDSKRPLPKKRTHKEHLNNRERKLKYVHCRAKLNHIVETYQWLEPGERVEFQYLLGPKVRRNWTEHPMKCMRFERNPERPMGKFCLDPSVKQRYLKNFFRRWWFIICIPLWLPSTIWEPQQSLPLGIWC